MVARTGLESGSKILKENLDAVGPVDQGGLFQFYRDALGKTGGVRKHTGSRPQTKRARSAV